jgi:hypothetical protein
MEFVTSHRTGTYHTVTATGYALDYWDSFPGKVKEFSAFHRAQDTAFGPKQPPSS